MGSGRHEGTMDRLVGIGFRRAAIGACVRAEEAIGVAEARMARGEQPVWIPVIDDLYALVTALSDAIGDLDAADDLTDAAERDATRARQARSTFHRIQATTGVLHALVGIR